MERHGLYNFNNLWLLKPSSTRGVNLNKVFHQIIQFGVAKYFQNHLDLYLKIKFIKTYREYESNF